MYRLLWATDLHLDWVEQRWRRDRFYQSVAQDPADALLVTGDIADGPQTEGRLRELAEAVGFPVYFVLGNHDYYGRSIGRGREGAARLAAERPGLVYLPLAGVVRLTANTALVGHDGWGDARLGDYEGSRVELNDFYLIEELVAANSDRGRLRQCLEQLGDEAAEYLARVLPQALDEYREVVVATHVPPFRESAWHRGTYSEDDWLPFFSCKAVGDVLRAAMLARPDRRMLVLCGHTHGSGETDVLPNLRVLTGGAEYGNPRVCRTLRFE